MQYGRVCRSVKNRCGQMSDAVFDRRRFSVIIQGFLHIGVFLCTFRNAYLTVCPMIIHLFFDDIFYVFKHYLPYDGFYYYLFTQLHIF